MSYTPNTWQTGDTITATKLNNIEQGISDTNYDLVIKLNSSTLAGASDFTVISGTYSACRTKALTNKQPLNVFVYGYDSNNVNFPFLTTFGVITAYYDNYTDDPNNECIRMMVIGKVDPVRICVRELTLVAEGTIELGNTRYISATTSTT